MRKKRYHASRFGGLTDALLHMQDRRPGAAQSVTEETQISFTTGGVEMYHPPKPGATLKKFTGRRDKRKR